MNLPLRIILLLLLLIVALSCSRSNNPESTSEAMRKKACKGDVAGFFSYIDKEQVTDNIRKQILADQGAPKDELEAQGQAFADKLVSTMVAKIWEGFEFEIRKGKGSSLCNMKISAGKEPDQVMWEFAANDTMVWQFTKREKNWIATSIITRDKKAESPDELAFKESTRGSPQPSEETAAAPAEEESYDFRKMKWGMSEEEVKQRETAPFDEEEEGGFLIYDTRISELPAKIVYVFVENKLVRAKYAFEAEHSNNNDYIIDYAKIKALVTEKYGAPSSDMQNWKSDRYKDTPQNWGAAISLGDLNYLTEWNTERTEITLALYGENSEITHAVDYISKELKGLEEEAEEKAEQGEF